MTFLTMVLFIESKHTDVVMWEMTDDSKNVIGGNSYWIKTNPFLRWTTHVFLGPEPSHSTLFLLC